MALKTSIPTNYPRNCTKLLKLNKIHVWKILRKNKIPDELIFQSFLSPNFSFENEANQFEHLKKLRGSRFFTLAGKLKFQRMVSLSTKFQHDLQILIKAKLQ